MTKTTGTTETNTDPVLPIKVFVYGSLKRGHGNNRLLGDPRHAQLIGRELLKGRYRLVDLGPFPGILENKAWPVAQILGELYAISAETLASLDILEGNRFFYTRKKVVVDGNKAWCYFLPLEDYASQVGRIDTASMQCWQPCPEEVAMVADLEEAEREVA